MTYIIFNPFFYSESNMRAASKSTPPAGKTSFRSMNHPKPPSIGLHSIADVQSAPDTRKLTIDKVGVKALRHPVRVKDRSGYEQHTVATFNMYVELPHNFKGTHMSRFVEIFSQH